MNYTNTSLTRVIEIGTDISRGLAYLHNRTPECVIHRDLKPQNVLLTKSGRAKIADFGISCFQKDPVSVYKMTGETGTYRYMAPEVIKNEQYNSSVDVFSFSMILYGLCEEKIPYSYLDTYEIRNSIKSGLRPKFSRLKNKDIQNIITKCWDSSSSNRLNALDVVCEFKNVSLNQYKSKLCCIM